MRELNGTVTMSKINEAAAMRNMKNQREIRKNQIETLIVSVVMSLITAFGIMAIFASITNSDMAGWDGKIAICIYFLISWFIFSIIEISQIWVD